MSNISKFFDDTMQGLLEAIDINKKDYYENIWFKLCCLYHAKTELYDRTLTDLRSPHDPTEAFIDEPCVRSLSNQYAKKLRNQILDIAHGLNLPNYIINHNMRTESGTRMYSAQRWIDTYYFLKEQGEYDFLD